MEKSCLGRLTLLLLSFLVSVSHGERCLLLDKSRRTSGGGYLVEPAALDAFARGKDASAGFACSADAVPAVLPAVLPPAESFECSVPPFDVRRVVFLVHVTSDLPLSRRLKLQLGDRGCNPLACVPGVWWNSSALRQAPVLFVEDCFSGTMCPEAEDLKFLKALGASVHNVWHHKDTEDNDLFSKHIATLRMVLHRFPDAQYVVKMDTDTILFPERYFSFLRMVHTAAGTSQPLYAGTLVEVDPPYIQGHAVTLNKAALERILAGLNASLASPRLVDTLRREGQHMEDMYMGIVNEDAGSYFLGCPRFQWWASHYQFRDPQESGATDPITIHKAEILPETMRLDIPERMCDVLRGWKCANNTAPRTHLPKIIWLLWFQGWDDAVTNEIIRGVRASWEFHNPGWKVVLVDNTTLPSLVDIPYLWRPDIQIQAKSDIVRLSLLAQHGGVWADASMLCLAPLDDWLPDAIKPGGFFAYHQGPNDDPNPGPCSWWLAAEHGSSIARAWKQRTNEFWAEPYDPDYEQAKGHWENYSYFWMENQFKLLHRTVPEFKDQWAKVPYETCFTPWGPASYDTHGELALAAVEAGYRNNTPNVIKLTTHGVSDEGLMLVRLAKERRNGTRIGSRGAEA